jgi:hypothetical protein
MPASDSASRTSSSLNGRMIAVISFMRLSMRLLRESEPYAGAEQAAAGRG